jgi:hypothetical protein
MDKSLTILLNLPGVFVGYCDYHQDYLYFYLKISSDAISCVNCAAYIEEFVTKMIAEEGTHSLELKNMLEDFS